MTKKKTAPAPLPLPPLPPFSVDLSDNTYGQVIYVFYRDNAAFRAWMKSAHGLEQGIDESEQTYQQFSEKINKYVFFTYVNDVTYAEEPLKTLVHETSHLVEFVLPHIGLKPHDKTSEAFSYFQEFLFGKIMKTAAPLDTPSGIAAHLTSIYRAHVAAKKPGQAFQWLKAVLKFAKDLLLIPKKVVARG